MASKRGLDIAIISKGQWGLGQDSRLLEQVLREINLSGIRIASVEHIDSINFLGSRRTPESVDIHIHLEVPCRAAWPWAKYNIVVVNQEWWYKSEWDWVTAPANEFGTGGANLFVFKSKYARNLFPIDDSRAIIVHWRTPSNVINQHKKKKNEFLFLVGASVNKIATAKQICTFWRAEWPALTIACESESIIAELRASSELSNINIRKSYETDIERIDAQNEYAYHIVASAAEGFGFTFAECATVGALPLWTDIPVYNELWGNVLNNIGRIDTIRAELSDNKIIDNYRGIINEDTLNAAVNSLLSLKPHLIKDLQNKLQMTTNVYRSEFRTQWHNIIKKYMTMKVAPINKIIVPPPPPNYEDLPKVGIITVTRNRPEWFTNMARNVLQCGYPASKLSWIIVDDGDTVIGKRLDEQAMKFAAKNPMIDVKYKSIVRQQHIGSKRNLAVKEAAEDVSVFVMMDDDDHYPEGNVALRVSWLRAANVGCVYCSTLPMYDCTKYISAMNVPPMNLNPSERVSEASMAFTREFWNKKGFPNKSMSEGSDFILDRISDTIEIPPAGVIVSFIHGGNSTSRRVPDGEEPNGCHYGFSDEYFTYISELGLPKTS